MIKKFKQYITETIKTIPTVWYHGSKDDFDEFKLKKGTLLDSEYTSPIFLTSDVNFAKEYAGYNNPVIYTVKLDNVKLMDFSTLPTSLELYLHEIKGENKYSEDLYQLGNELLEYIEEKFDDDYTEKRYNNLLSNDYSSIEQTWVYDFLKYKGYAGAYVKETDILNVFIFSPTKIKIVDKSNNQLNESKSEKLEKIYGKKELENKINEYVEYIKSLAKNNKLKVYRGIDADNVLDGDDFSNSYTLKLDIAKGYGNTIISGELSISDIDWIYVIERLLQKIEFYIDNDEVEDINLPFKDIDFEYEVIPLSDNKVINKKIKYE